jgi:hypothetical protein
VDAEPKFCPVLEDLPELKEFFYYNREIQNFMNKIVKIPDNVKMVLTDQTSKHLEVCGEKIIIITIF